MITLNDAAVVSACVLALAPYFPPDTAIDPNAAEEGEFVLASLEQIVQAVIDAALPYLRKDWEGPLREYVDTLDTKASDLAKRCRNCGRPIHPIERKQVVFHPTMPAFTEWEHGTGGHWCDGDSSERATPRTDATLDRIRADLRALLAPEATP